MHLAHRSRGIRPTFATLCVAGLALTGCGSGDDSSEGASTSSEPTGPGMTVAQAQRIMTDYDARNNPAIKAAQRAPYDEKQWAKADMGPTLEADVYDTRITRAEPPKKPDAATALKHKVAGVIGGAKHRKGAVALVRGPVEETPAPTTTDPRAKDRETARIMYRPGATGDWRLWTSFGVKTTDLPAALPIDTDPTPTAQMKKVSKPLVSQFAESIQEEAGAPFSDTKLVKDMLADLWPKGAGIGSARTMTCTPYAARGSQDRGDALLTVLGAKTLVSVVTLRCEVHLTTEGRWTYDKALAKVNKWRPGESDLTLHRVVSGLFVQRSGAGQEPRLIGVNYKAVVPGA